jgi:hypothetical protein
MKLTLLPTHFCWRTALPNEVKYNNVLEFVLGDFEDQWVSCMKEVFVEFKTPPYNLQLE